MKRDLKIKNVNPRDLKAKLAKEIVRIYHGKTLSEKAEKEFNKVFREKELPSKIKEVKIKEKRLNILELLLKTKMVSSKSEAKRLVLQKAVRIGGSLKEDWKESIRIEKGLIIKVGKRRFLKIT